MKVRKRPVEVDAVQFLGFDPQTNAPMFSENPLPDWLNKEIHYKVKPFGCDSLMVDSLEGKVRAVKTSWIIKGVHGELYPCQNDIFLKTYDI